MANTLIEPDFGIHVSIQHMGGPGRMIHLDFGAKPHLETKKDLIAKGTQSVGKETNTLALQFHRVS